MPLLSHLISARRQGLVNVTKKINRKVPKASLETQYTEVDHLLYSLYDPSWTKGKPYEMEIVFLHGFGSTPLQGWRDSRDILWPALYIPQDFPHCRVWSVGYDPNQIELQDSDNQQSRRKKEPNLSGAQSTSSENGVELGFLEGEGGGDMNASESSRSSGISELASNVWERSKSVSQPVTNFLFSQMKHYLPEKEKVMNNIHLLWDTSLSQAEGIITRSSSSKSSASPREHPSSTDWKGKREEGSETPKEPSSGFLHFSPPFRAVGDVINGLGFGAYEATPGKVEKIKTKGKEVRLDAICPQGQGVKIHPEASASPTRILSVSEEDLSHPLPYLRRIALDVGERLRGAGVGCSLTPAGSKDAEMVSSPPPPVVFVCHSMGGLVVKSLIVSLEEELQCPRTHRMGFEKTQEQRRKKEFLNSISGVVFFATPHFGAPLVTLVSSLHPYLTSAILSPVLKELSEDPPENAKGKGKTIDPPEGGADTKREETEVVPPLVLLNQKFLSIVEARSGKGGRRRIDLLSLGETEKLHGVTTVVPAFSANLFGTPPKKKSSRSTSEEGQKRGELHSSADGVKEGEGSSWRQSVSESVMQYLPGSLTEFSSSEKGKSESGKTERKPRLNKESLTPSSPLQRREGVQEGLSDGSTTPHPLFHLLPGLNHHSIHRPETKNASSYLLLHQFISRILQREKTK